MSGYDTGMDFETDVDLTLTAPAILDIRRGTSHEWDAYVRADGVALSDLNRYVGSASIAAFAPDEAERLGRRLIAAAQAVRAAERP